MTKRAVLWTAGALGLLAMLAVLALSSGWRLFTVLTPSMGTTAPVGTLVVSRAADSYHVGEIVSYDNTKGRIYTHRITEIAADGIFITKGDLNVAPDPLPVSKAQVIGRAVWLLPGWGWVLRALPLLIIGFVLVYLVSLIRRIQPPWQWVVRISGWTLVVALAAIWLRPWVALDMLGFDSAATGGVQMHVVNTGLFPLDVLGNRIVSGQDTIVHVTQQNQAGQYTLTPSLALDWWQQVVFILVCLIPTAAALLIRDVPRTRAATVRPATEDALTHDGGANDGLGILEEDTTVADGAWAAEIDAGENGGSAGTSGTGVNTDRRRLLLALAIVLAVIFSVAVVTLTATHSSLTAAVQNTKNTAGTRVTCRGALASVGKSNTVFAFALEPTGASAKTETDISQNTSGTYTQTPVKYTGAGCTQDSPLSAVTFNGTSQCLYSGLASASALTTFSLEAWFRTGTTTNGKIIGFGAAQNSPAESTYDRHIYIDSAGKVVFGVYNGGYQTITTPGSTSYADSKWHHVIATFSSAGMVLYVDGAQVATSANGVAESTTGFWKVGRGNLNGWPNVTGSTSTTVVGGTTITMRAGYFNGQIQYAAVYKTVLTAAQATAHYQAGLA